ncbi:28S ribosomal protein S11, mitochondrial [Ochotona curzoniae]|uniref:28S ribosomal protein S11, mitochondrial n=1 Tax=Ochotona curzoniae TaxID=130825 RepID=UPI001B34F471|nr:28S ribosomal protein S11, mitochondrial [Ochotona curzoniae]
MQAVRAAGSWALRACSRPRAPGVVAGARGLCAAPPPEAAEQTTARRGGFSIYPPLPGQESSLRWAGKKFEEIPIAHIKASYNNTQIQVVSATNQPLARTSCGTEGFRNAKKATGVAAQTAAIAAAAKASGKGVTHVRVVVKGLGPGRLSAIKGLTMGGLEVISITDNTPIPHNGCRPKKARRL